MANKILILDSTQAGTTRSSSYIYDNDSLELVWKNGQIHVQGVSASSATRKTPSCDGHSKKAINEDARIAKSAKLTHQPATTGNSNSYTSSTNQFSDPFKKPRMDSSQTPATNSQKLSDVLRPLLFLKSTYQGNTTTLPTNNTVLAQVEVAKAAPDCSMVIDSSKGSSHGLQGPKFLTSSDAPNWVSFVPRSQEIPPDQQSEAVGQYSNQTTSSAGLNKTKGKADTNYFDEPLHESSSICSLGASSNTNESTYLSDVSEWNPILYFSPSQLACFSGTLINLVQNNEEEPEDVVKEKIAREGTRVKKRRNIEIHSLYERKRRDKINKRMRTLKELIPNCKKMDKASMLDDAIEYLKTLKLQLQIMSMGAGFRMPLMMLPNATHHMINTSHLSQLMGAGMGFRPGTGIPCSLPQFPIAPLPAINGVRMFGFPNQVPVPMPTMPISHAPFIPMVGNPSTQPLLATSIANKLVENQASAQLTTLMTSVSPQELIS